MQGIEVGRATARSEAEGRHLPRRIVDRQAQPAVRPPGQNPARETEFPRPRPPHLRRHRLDHGPDEPGASSTRSPTKPCSTCRLTAVDTMTITGTVKGDGPVLAVVSTTDRKLSRHAALSPKEHQNSKPSNSRSKRATPICPPVLPDRSQRPQVKAEIEKLGLKAVALPSCAQRPEARRRSAAPRRIQHLGQHAGRGLGALRLRPFRSRLRSHL